MSKRKLFCEISPLTYKISVFKEKSKRNIKVFVQSKEYAKEKSNEKLPVLVYSHNSLIRRTLGNVDLSLQDNKAVNLSLAAPKITGIIIKPGERFSFWNLVGDANVKNGYKEGLVIKSGRPDKGVGGGLCQFTNLIHWMILHSPLDIIEHHHHNHLDLFPDFKRVVPFGTGTSIMYNYLDYQFKNNTDVTFQLIVYTTDKYLCGELRSSEPLKYSYHIVEENLCFAKVKDEYYRRNEIYREIVDKRTGKVIDKELIIKNNSKTMYDSSFIDKKLIIEE